MYSVCQIVEMLKDHWDKESNVNGEYLSYNEKTITEILKKDILGSKFGLAEGERKKVTYTNFNQDTVTEPLYVFPKYPEYGGKIATSSVWDTLGKKKSEKIIYVNPDTVRVENKKNDKPVAEQKAGRKPYLVSYGYYFSLRHELERRALPVKYALFDMMTKKMIQNKILSEVKVDDMQELLNKVEEILTEFGKSINESLAVINSAFQVERQRLMDIRTFVVMRQKMRLLSSLDTVGLDKTIAKMNAPLEYRNGTIKKLNKLKKDFNDGFYQMSFEENINYVAAQIYEYEKYEKKQYDSFLLKVWQKEVMSWQFRSRFGDLVYESAMLEPTEEKREYLIRGMETIGIKY